MAQSALSGSETADVIWWPGFCGNSSPYDAFWNSSLTVNTDTPDFTDCFQNTVLLWIPCGYIWVVGVFYICYLSHKKTVNLCGHVRRFNLFKIVLGVVLILTYLVDLLHVVASIYDDYPIVVPSAVKFVAPLIGVITMVIVTFIIALEFRKGLQSSGILFVFWFMVTLTSIVQLRSKIIRAIEQGYVNDVFRFVITCIYFVSVLAQFVSSWFADVHATVGVEEEGWQEESYPLLADKWTSATNSRKNPCPLETASFPSYVMFVWFTGMIIRGFRRALVFQDIWDLREKDSCAHIVRKFSKAWQSTSSQNRTKHSEVEKPPKSNTEPNGFNISKYQRLKSGSDGSPSLTLALAKTFWPLIAAAGLLVLLYDIIIFINPFLLRSLINFISNRDPYAWKGYLLAVAMSFMSFVEVLFVHHFINFGYVLGMRVRSAMISAIYRKALRLSSKSRNTVSVGEIVNLMSVDAQKLQDGSVFLNQIWSAPLTVAISLYFLWQILGPSCLGGLAIVLILVPANSFYIGNKVKNLQFQQMRYKDTRIKLVNQIMTGIKVLKLYAWEPFFRDRVSTTRDRELRLLRKAAILNSVNYITWFCSPFLVAVGCFTVYVLSSPDHVLDAQTAFVSLSLINLLNFPLTLLPQTINSIIQASVSLKRISRFLQLEEVQELTGQDYPKDGDININRGYFSWGIDDRIALRNINLSVRTGELVAVVGQVGSGKSSLVSAMLGEMEQLGGSLSMKESVAYVPQQAWIQNLSLRKNILFEKQFRREMYSRVLDACALKPDLQILPGGDRTEIGERGINLSGGQKQRVSLARAIYQNCDIYLMDDPLSAVDSHVGKHIFQHAIGPEGLLKNKTRIFVTHGITYLRKVDKIIVMKDGEISEQGTYKELLWHDGAFSEFIRTYLQETQDSSVGDSDEKEERDHLEKAVSQFSSGDVQSFQSSEDTDASSSCKSSGARSRKRRKSSTKGESSKANPKHVTRQEVAKRLIREETIESGSIKMSVLKSYVRAGSIPMALVTILCMLVLIGSQTGTNIWLSAWTDDVPINGTQDIALRNLRLGVYAGLGVLQTLCVFTLACCVAVGSMRASTKLHNGLLDNIIRSPMSFFDTTPLGRIVNRFSKDIDILDINIPLYVQMWMTTFSPVLTTLIVIAYSLPIFLAVVVPLVIVFILLQRVYIACARQIKRLDAIRRSPIYGNFSETLNGVTSIRAYKQQDRFIEYADRILDESQMVWFAAFSSNRWISTTSEGLCVVVVLMTSILSVVAKDVISPGLVGLAVSFSLQMAGNLVSSVRASCELETYIVAVERIKEYSEVDQEAPWTILDRMPPREWPTKGKIEYQNYKTRYRPGLDMVLKGVSCKIESEEKVGIVGRTGAGKSSMALSLFRIIEACGGCILIDGMDVSRMGLHSLRSKLSIIPQDPVIFSGTLRFNLDPAERYKDSEIWTALEYAHLKNFVMSLPEQLYYECGEDGDKLSVGQRQLICLARALLRKSKVLVLDEATAAVDLETDDLIQASIRSQFNDCTVLTIAHRINTIMDYDRIIVMADGVIQEFGSPAVLLGDINSSFYAMARDAGLV